MDGPSHLIKREFSEQLRSSVAKNGSGIPKKRTKLKQFVNLNLNIIIIIKIPERLFPTDAR
jgi:hypothetical protein